VTVLSKTAVVVTGGRSAERDRSLLSGQAVHESLTRQGIPHSVLDAADPSFYDSIRDAEFAFLAIAGQWAEDGKLQGLLEHLGVPYTGSGVECDHLNWPRFGLLSSRISAPPGW
jgi:D-alanine-D-alanine ligase